MRYFGRIVVSVIVICLTSFSQSVRIPNLQTSKVQCVSENLLYRQKDVPGTFYIERSDDAGLTWTPFTVARTTVGYNSNAYLFSFYCIDSSELYLLSKNSEMYRKSDSTNWTKYILPFSYSNIVLLAPGGKVRVILMTGGSNRATLVSSDGGVTWIKNGLPNTTIGKATSSFTSSGYGWVIFGSTMYRTSNFGASWVTLTSPVAGHSIYFKDAQNGWIGSTNGTLARTTDGGTTWKIVNGICAGSINALKSVQGKIMGCTSNGNLIRNNGINDIWDSTVIMQGKNFTDFVSDGTDRGYFFSENEVYRYSLNQAMLYAAKENITSDAENITIRWESVNIKSLRFTASCNGGRTWQTLGTGIAADKEEFTFPHLLKNYIVRIEDEQQKIKRIELPDVHFTFSRGNSAFSGNRITMLQSSNMTACYNSAGSGSSGFYWPNAADPHKTAIYTDGFLYAGKIGGIFHVGGNTYRSAMRPGRILADGKIESQFSSETGIWRIKKNRYTDTSEITRTQLLYDSLYWPGFAGAPYIDVNQNSQYDETIDRPAFIGDEVLWLAGNDTDTNLTTFLYGTDPIGIEQQCTIFGVNTPGLENTVFRKYTITNKSNSTVDSMYAGIWTDIDLGDASDDYIGFDHKYNMIYGYNGDNDDAYFYGNHPPAIGYALLSGPVVAGAADDSAYFGFKWEKGKKNLGATAAHCINKSSIYTDASLGVYSGAIQIYNQMQGKTWSGLQITNPVTGNITPFMYDGDPVIPSGWNEGLASPSDRRAIMSCGPFTLKPGETQEFTFAMVIDTGDNRLGSITKIRGLVNPAKQYYYNLRASVSYTNRVHFDEKAEFNYTLYQSYPNPFNPTTTIKYELGNNTQVSIVVYDILGREVTTLVNEVMERGEHTVQFNAFDYNLASGVYFYRIQAGGYSSVKKMMLLK